MYRHPARHGSKECFSSLSSQLKQASETVAQDDNIPLSNENRITKKKLGLLTFDLDDTLFPTTQVVQDANQVMIQTIYELTGITTTVKQFMETTRLVRKEQNGQPITYSDLRRKSIARELERRGYDSSSSDEQETTVLVESCFQAWLEERHLAAERYLFDNVIPMLQEIRSRHGNHDNDEGRGLCIAAITNGRGNPLEMTQTIAPYFDFCVSGEDDEVFPHRKPHSQIYQHAYQQYQQQRQQQQNNHNNNNNNDNNEDNTQNNANDVWFHVGDCLANDVGPSAENGAMAIWLAPSSMATERTDPTPSTTNNNTPQGQEQEQQPWSTATETEVVKRSQLAQAAQSKVAARITQLSQLPQVIDDLLTTTTHQS